MFHYWIYLQWNNQCLHTFPSSQVLIIIIFTFSGIDFVELKQSGGIRNYEPLLRLDNFRKRYHNSIYHRIIHISIWVPLLHEELTLFPSCKQRSNPWRLHCWVLINKLWRFLYSLRILDKGVSLTTLTDISHENLIC